MTSLLGCSTSAALFFVSKKSLCFIKFVSGRLHSFLSGITVEFEAYLLSDTAARVGFLAMNEKTVNIAKVNQWRCLEVSELWLGNVD